jgi:nucleoside-triphosphatase THEP1
MNPVKINILVTGLPGIGKTTLVKQLIYRISLSLPVGFYTEEIRQEGEQQTVQAHSALNDMTEGYAKKRLKTSEISNLRGTAFG